MAEHDQNTNRFLQKIAYLLPLSSEEEASVQDLFTRGRAVRAHMELIRQGAAYRGGYLLQTGWAIRAKLLPDGRRQILNFVLPGDVVGLASPFFTTVDYAVTTLEPSRVTALPLARVATFFQRQPRLGAVLCWQLAQEEALVSEQLVNVGRRDAYSRVGHLLAELYWRLDSVGLVQHATYTLPPSQPMLADALGLSAVHVNRTLRRLRQDGLVVVNGSRVVIDNLPALERAVDFDRIYLHVTATPVWLRRYRVRPREETC